MPNTDSEADKIVNTGIPGLDEVLLGGLVPNVVYLVEGESGAGKTTLGLQFLLEGVRRGEPALHITLSESAAELRTAAGSHGWTLDGITIFELLPAGDAIGPEAQYTMFHPSEVELGESTRKIFAEVERTGARRVVIDSVADMRLMAQNPLWFRRQLLALKRFFAGRQCTVLLTEEETEEFHTRTVVEGVLRLEQMAPEYGGHRRRLRVLKIRGKEYRGGYHDFNITRGGLVIFPRLVALEHRQAFSQDQVRSGIPELDALTGGGLSRGSSTLMIGPSGSGKSSLAGRYLFTFAEDGGKGAVFLFDENIESFTGRARALGMDLAPHLQGGSLRIQQVDPAELSPGEFAAAVRSAVDEGARMVVIDSLSGYIHAMPEEHFLMLHLHELLTSLNQQGVTTLMIVTQHGLLGSDPKSALDLSYLSDAVILLRFFEAEAEVRQAISMVKKRGGAHEHTIRELKIESTGIHIGEPLRQFHGVLTGNPTFHGPAGRLMESDEGQREHPPH